MAPARSLGANSTIANAMSLRAGLVRVRRQLLLLHSVDQHLVFFLQFLRFSRFANSTAGIGQSIDELLEFAFLVRQLSGFDVFFGNLIQVF